MRLRIRTLLLTVAMLCVMTSTASACIYVPILNPFCWLFGGCGCGGYDGCGYGSGGYGYGSGGCGCDDCGGSGYGGYNGCGYSGYRGSGYAGGSYAASSYNAGGHGAGGYGPVGYVGGYGPTGYCCAGTPNLCGVGRFINDMLGIGCLRNQQGFGCCSGCYQPLFPGLLSPCGPHAPVCSSMVAPYYPMVPPPGAQYQMPTMDRPCDGGCGNGMDAMLPASYPQMSPGSMTTRQRSFTANSSFQNVRQYPQYSQYPQPAWQRSMSGSYGIQQTMPVTSASANPRHRQQHPSNLMYGGQYPTQPQATAWQAVPSQSMPRTAYAPPRMTGVVYGNHEYQTPASAPVPVVPNSFNRRAPIRRASLSQPPRTVLARQYPNSVQ